MQLVLHRSILSHGTTMSFGGSTNFFASYKWWAASSLGAAYILVNTVPQLTIRHSTWGTATAIFFLQWLVYGIYAVIIYHRFISPLRHLPTVEEGNNWFFGQWLNIGKEPSGVPMRRWQNQVPNQGLVRYLGLFNRERLLITSPKALQEILQTKNYDFARPRFLLAGVGKILVLDCCWRKVTTINSNAKG